LHDFSNGVQGTMCSTAMIGLVVVYLRSERFFDA
jgi:hypothetical protein